MINIKFVAYFYIKNKRNRMETKEQIVKGFLFNQNIEREEIEE